jgi:hypothetical protein
MAYDPESIGRYYMAPGTKVLLLNERDEQLHLDLVLWSYAPRWWDKSPLIRRRLQAACLNRYGSTAVLSALPMSDLNGKLKETRSSLISFSAPTVSPFS